MNPVEMLFSSAEQPFQWGENDCCFAVANSLEQIYQKNFMDRFKGRYSTLTGYRRLLKSEGFESLEHAMDSVLGAGVLGMKKTQEETGDWQIGLAKMNIETILLDMPMFKFGALWHGRSHAGIITLPNISVKWA